MVRLPVARIIAVCGDSHHDHVRISVGAEPGPASPSGRGAGSWRAPPAKEPSPTRPTLAPVALVEPCATTSTPPTVRAVEGRVEPLSLTHARAGASRCCIAHHVPVEPDPRARGRELS